MTSNNWTDVLITGPEACEKVLLKTENKFGKTVYVIGMYVPHRVFDLDGVEFYEGDYHLDEDDGNYYALEGYYEVVEYSCRSGISKIDGDILSWMEIPL